VQPPGHRPTYVQRVAFLDHETGRVLSALSDAGVEGDTLVLFTSVRDSSPRLRTAPRIRPICSSAWLRVAA
jgi:hypothetical protein